MYYLFEKTENNQKEAGDGQFLKKVTVTAVWPDVGIKKIKKFAKVATAVFTKKGMLLKWAQRGTKYLGYLLKLVFFS